MCGLFGYIGVTSFSLPNSINIINHRGPDAEGFLTYFDEGSKLFRNSDASLIPGKKVSFGFKRLSIIDLNPQSNQPFSDLTNKFHIIFNGEIYNYLELREELKLAGFKFKTNSDTEVLLNSYIHWGTNCFSKFNGMWAVLILDLNKNSVIISRDRFGVKPLYYFIDNEGIYFFSEIKQIFSLGKKKEVNNNLIVDYLKSGLLDHSNETFFKGVLKFPSSHYCEVDLNGKNERLEFKKFWDLDFNSTCKLSYEESVEQFKELFKNSVELRFRSDVPIGACLSGGLDSSSIVSLAGFLNKNITAFSVDNKDKKLSEINYVNDIINKYQPINSIITYNEPNDLDLLDEIFLIQDEPISGLGVIAQWRVMKLASENNVTVLLDGQGGDEILGGYRKFVYFYLKELLYNKNYFTFLKELFYFFSSSDFKLFEKEGLLRYLGKTKTENFIVKNLTENNSNSKIGLNSAYGFKTKCYNDIFKYSYPVLLRYEDRNSMAFNLETRVPFLDYRLVEFVFSLPTSYILRNGYTKSILRDSMKNILPDSIRLRKSKLGFATPEEELINKRNKEYFINYFQNIDNPFFDNVNIKLNFFKKGKFKIDYKTLLRFYLFDRWYKFHFKSNA